MDQPDLDEAEKKRRKEEIVAWREQKRISTLFMLGASFFEILETIFVILILFLLDSILFLKVLDSTNSTVQLVYEISMIVIFILGFVLGFIIYKKVIRWFIVKFGWDKKLSEDVLKHYVKKSEEEIKMELKK